MKLHSVKLVLILATLVAINAAAVAQKNRYTFSSLGFSGSINGVHQPLGVSSAGQVVGYNNKTGAAFNWSNGTLGSFLPSILSTVYSQATQISENGVFVATGSANGAIIYNEPGPWTVVGIYNYLSLGVNDSGFAVGQMPVTVNGQSQTRAFFFNSNINMLPTSLGSFGGGSVATAINNNGLIVGYSATTTGYTRAFQTTFGGTMTDFDPNFIVYDSSANAVNDLGTVVGATNRAGCVFPPIKFVHVCRGLYSYPAIFNANGTVTQIGNLGGNGGAALAINNAGDIVGWNLTASGERHAFLYTGGQTYDLNLLMPLLKNFTITEASAINDSGMIVAHATSLLSGDVIVVLAP